MFQLFFIKIYSYLFGKRVGVDNFGNTYYVCKRNFKEKRWVLYNGDIDTTKVPPVWRLWLRHTVFNRPSIDSLRIYPWQKQHEINNTGTNKAYYPNNLHTKQYEEWKPNK